MNKNHFPFINLGGGEHDTVHKKILRTVKAKADKRRSTSEKLADWMTSTFGSIWFLLVNIVVFVFWILINTGHFSGIVVFDPYPFNLLTTAVSLEAIILAIFVLISQNRAMKVDDLREELDLQIGLITEKEVTKIMHMLSMLLEKNGIDVSGDAELKKLSKSIDENELEKKLEKEIL